MLHMLHCSRQGVWKSAGAASGCMLADFVALWTHWNGRASQGLAGLGLLGVCESGRLASPARASSAAPKAQGRSRANTEMPNLVAYFPGAASVLPRVGGGGC